MRKYILLMYYYKYVDINVEVNPNVAYVYVWDDTYQDSYLLNFVDVNIK
jgi:hypothetical protein